jgi:hypothetical protein
MLADRAEKVYAVTLGLTRTWQMTCSLVASVQSLPPIAIVLVIDEQHKRQAVSASQGSLTHAVSFGVSKT